ncbi:MAG: hypothetical protein KI790_01240 [Cyclobacteriaceae bacterium]|nr:hypothetical protein [Cyclobacteriaceae bacterium HetDA_MAG_MS6]
MNQTEPRGRYGGSLAIIKIADFTVRSELCIRFLMTSFLYAAMPMSKGMTPEQYR